MKSRACIRRSREQRKPLLSLNQWLNRGGVMGTNLRQPLPQPRAATKAAWGRGDMRGSSWPRALPARHQGGVGTVRYARQQLGAGSACLSAVSREQRKPLLSLNQWLNRGGIMGTNLRQPLSQPRAATKAAWGRGDYRGSSWVQAQPARPFPGNKGSPC